MNTKIRNLLLALTATLVVVAGGCTVDDTSGDKSTAADRNAEQDAQNTDAPKANKPAKPKYTKEQEQAIGTAHDYLDYTAFSKSGLIGQIASEGYSRRVATFAVNHIRVDYNKQAQLSAKDYLNYTHFSRQGLIDQLKSEGYTQAQAEYGVSKNGL